MMKDFFSRFRSSGLSVLALCALMVGPHVHAAEPASGTISAANPEIVYTSGPFFVSNPSGTADIATGGVTCQDPVAPCDEFTLTVDLPADYATTHPLAKLQVSTAWDNSAEDYDIYLLNDQGSEVANSAGSGDPEVMQTTPTAGTYTIRIVPFTVAGSTTTTTVSLITPAPGEVVQQPQAQGLPPRFTLNPSPPDLANSAGEPSIGYNPLSKYAMFIAGLQTLRVTFPENSSQMDALGAPLPESCDATWQDVSYVTTSTESLDPILFTEQTKGRTFVSQLTAANSLFAYTDDDGDSWTPGQIASPPNGGVDHQTVGAGPYPANFVGVENPDGYAVYYCSQSTADGLCARSDDGGLTFGPGIPFGKRALCGDLIGALHGHVRVAPDGTVYVPDKSCGSEQGVFVSEDAGMTWAAHTVPGSLAGDNDPQMALASDGTGYFCYVNGDGHPHAAVTHDKGATFENDYDLGSAVGVVQAVFPQGIAGDPDRAACAFIGTQTAGNYQATDFTGIWYAYIAMTYDGGKTWHTVNITPNDPVQGAGGICTGGTTCGSNRNLLDFNEMTLDEKGRPLFGFADGCIDACVKDPTKNSFTAKGVIARQSGGRTLLSALDPVDPTAPKASCLAGTRTSAGSTLTWKQPDNGGADITKYRIYRGTVPGSETLLAETAQKTSYVDTTADSTVSDYFYKITATNARGEGLFSNVLDLPLTQEPIVENSCSLPGITVSTEGSAGECTGSGGVCTPQYDLQKASVAELASLPDSLVFDIKVADLSPAPTPGNYYFVLTKDTAGNDIYLSMDTATGTPTYSYGTYADAGAGVLTFSPVGTLNSASTYSTDGNIYLVADKSVFGNLQPGDTVSPIDVRTRAGADSIPSRDTLGNGSYVLKGTAACAVAGLPLAQLGADVQQGDAPLSVNFTVTGGVGNPGDTLVSYSLDFGDGQSVADQPFNGASSVQVAHSYTADGNYPARLTVKDSNGTVSSNRAERVIEVGTVSAPGGGGTGSTAPADQGRFGGALGLALLLPLLGGAAIRRRRLH